RIGELADEEGCERREHDPRCLPENRHVSRLVVPACSRWQRDHDPAHERRKNNRSKTSPDDLARSRIAVNLGEHIVEDVTDREEKDTSAKRKAPNRADFCCPDKVRTQQDGNEKRHDQVVVPKPASTDLRHHLLQEKERYRSTGRTKGVGSGVKFSGGDIAL